MSNGTTSEKQTRPIRPEPVEGLVENAQAQDRSPSAVNEPEVDFSSHDSLTGFRLQRLEVLNWGTFDKKVWAL